MKTNGSTPTRTQRLDSITKSLKELREAEQQRRVKAGAQLQRDSNHSPKWQNRKLPTYNP